MAKLAPPTFDERDGQLIGGKWFDLFVDSAGRKCIELYYAKQTAVCPDGYMGVTWHEVNEHAWLMFCCSWSVLACAAFLRSVS